ncbi:MAG: ATP-binding protein [Negativicutes bacterium]|nr:ATP-binding protein [Negativicutes bacterium]
MAFWHRVVVKKNIVPEQIAQLLLKGHYRPWAVRALSGYSWPIVLLEALLIGGLWLFVGYQINDDYGALAGFEQHKHDYIVGALFGSLFILFICSLLFNGMRRIIRDNEQRYESLLEGMSDAFAYGRIVYENNKPVDFIHLAVNDAFIKLTGLKDVVGKSITEVLPGIQAANPEILEVCGRVSSTGRSERFEVYLAPLNIWLENAVFSKQKGYFMAVFNNITERKVMEEELNKHREQLQILVDEQTCELEKAVHEIRRQNAMLAGINRILLEALICKTEEELGRKCLAVLEEVTHSKFGFIGRINATGKMKTVAISNPGWDACSLLDKTGHIRVPSESEVKGLYGRLILDGRGFFTNDPSSHPDSSGLPEGHPPIKAFLGTPLIVEGKPFGLVVLGNRVGGYSEEDLHTAETMSQSVMQAFMHVRSQQELMQKNDEITTKEKELARLDMLNTVGEMAASIGHEVRNPLTTVRGYLQFYGQKSALVDYREPFDLMIKELDRANAIITDFLSLAKNKTVSLIPTNLNQIVEGLVPLLKADALRRGSDIEMDLEHIPDVLADDKEIRQCILNLVSNGLDVTPKGDKVIIKTSNAGNLVVLTVQDRGPGIPPEIIDKLGTPFLTTKENGTGLGLPVCYRIAERHGAKIDVHTSPKGTTFNVYFKAH